MFVIVRDALVYFLKSEIVAHPLNALLDVKMVFGCPVSSTPTLGGGQSLTATL